MADQKISAMPSAATPLTGAELVPLVQDGGNVQSTIANFALYARGQYFNHAAFQSTATQTGSISTGTVFTYNVTDVADGVTLVDGSKLTVPLDGVYNIQWSGQFQNVENAVENVKVWVRINGVDVAGSAGNISMQPRKSSLIPNEVIASWNYFLTLTAGQYVELVWLPSIATLTMPALPASVSPAYPATASVIVTVNQVA